MDSGSKSLSDGASKPVSQGTESKSKRRKTSHLKLVPETRELRERLRQRCSEVASRLDKSHPLTKDEMEKVARAVLDDLQLPEGYVGWTMVMLSSEFFRDQVAATDPKRRLFLLPHCLKHAEGCPADYDEFGMNCKKCGACSIADFRVKAEEMGYKVLVAEGSPVVLKIIVSGYVDASSEWLVSTSSKKRSIKSCWPVFHAWRFRYCRAIVATRASMKIG